LRFPVQVTLLFLAGAVLPFDDQPDWWRWYAYINFLRYAYAALLINQFDGMTENTPNAGGPILIADQQILKYYGVHDFSSSWEVIGYECLFFVAIFFLAWAALQFMKLSKR
jgi:ATP-binding cassette, subfamily G (WHITE), member 2